MGTKAQQALERSGTATRAGSANQRNQAGTRKAQALARRNTGIDSSGSSGMKKSDSALGPSNRSYDPTERAMDKLENTEVGPGTGGYGPTTGGDKALRKASERADPGRLIRDTIGAMSEPKVVRAPGSIWDDPQYAAMANEHGAEFAMRARNLDQKINSARQYREMLDAGRERRYEEEARRRDDMRDQAGFQQEMAAAGTPQQLEQTFGPGAKRNPDGSISRATSGEYDATDETGAFTGARSGEQEEQLMPSQVPPTDKETLQATQAHETRMQGIKSITEALSAELGKGQYEMDEKRIKGLQKQLNQLISGSEEQGGGGKQSITGPDGKEYKIGDKLPNGRTLSGINDDGTIEVE